MKALAVIERGAEPTVADLPEPDPGAGDVRVAVEAASINGFDLSVAGGYVWDFMPHTFPVIIGRDFAGAVDAVGDGVTDLSTGDRVAGVITAMELGAGPIAERFVTDAKSVVPVPDGVSAVQAAAVGLAGAAARDVFDALNLSDADTALVSGATGGVGSFLVQLAAAAGARVIATASPGEEADFVRRLGASDVVDHTGDLEAAVRAIVSDGVDKIAHLAGDPAALGRLLTPGGLLASLVGATDEQVGRQDATVTGVMAMATPEKLSRFLDDVAADRLTVEVTSTYSLSNAVDALADFSDGKIGKIVVTNP